MLADNPACATSPKVGFEDRLTRAVEHEGAARDVAAVKLMLNAGLRIAELCAVAWKDIIFTSAIARAR